MMPETGSPRTLGVDVKPHYDKDENLILAIINGSKSGLQLLGGQVPEDLKRFEKILRAGWRAFDAAAESARGKALATGPRAPG